MVSFSEMAEGLLVGRMPGVFASRYLSALATVLAVATIATTMASTGYSIYSGVTSSKEAKHAEHKAERLVAYKEQKAQEQAAAERLRRSRLGRQQTWLTKGIDLGTATIGTAGLKSKLGG